MMVDKAYQPIIILGAGRSGTNMLRDCLTGLDDFATWPCDEIQPIWRYRNRNFATDALPVALAVPRVKSFINNAFDTIWQKTGRKKYIVEKTCANTLRVPYVDAAIDDAFYIHLVRHGSEVVPSAMKRWRGELEVPRLAYFAAKARYIPILDIPSYLQSFLSKRIGILLGKRRHLSTWGPRFEGIDALAKKNLEQTCAYQWINCVQEAKSALESIDEKRWILVYYEDFISDPVTEMKRILTKIGADIDADSVHHAIKEVRVRQADKSGSSMDDPDLIAIMAPCIKELGYGIKE